MRRFFAGLLIPVLTSTAAAQGSLTGYVRDETTLRGLQGAEISVSGTDHRTKTDKDGRYTLKDILPGTQRIAVRAVGYAPVDTALAFSADKPTENVFFLGKPAVALDTVKTNSQNRVQDAGFGSFELRRSKGFGKFIDSVTLRQNEHRRLPDLLNNFNGLEMGVPGTCRLAHAIMCNWRVAVSRRSTQTFCANEVLLDGTVVQRDQIIDDRDAPPFSPPAVMQAYLDAKEKAWSKTFDLNSVNISNLVGVEYYRSAADAPDVFGGNGAGCGVLLLWTRR